MGPAIREAVGETVDIMIDCHGRHALANAIEFCRVLAPYRPYFLEEPVPPENVDVLAEVRKASPIPIATGERLITRYQFRELFEKQACNIIQPDLCHCGGLWEAKKIAAMAETYYMGVAPHNPLGPSPTPPPFILPSARLIFSSKRICSPMSPGAGKWCNTRSKPNRATGSLPMRQA
ncbi:MAG: mandelate racemase/muconate lactonizing enzyme family protein [Caldilineaceae bacterium]